MRIAMMGTRGVPAAYGGFETAIEEIGTRLAARGHEVLVYCRGSQAKPDREYRGMQLVHLPALKSKSLETLSHTGFSTLHLLTHRKPDALFVFNAANAPFLPFLRWGRAPIAVHVDGLEWLRGKWGPNGKRYYRWAEQSSVKRADALIADAAGIADYYRHEFDVDTRLIAYGATIIAEPAADRLPEMDVERHEYHVVVARFEPENHVLEIVEGYAASDAKRPLVVVGKAPYAAEYTDRIAAAAASDPRIRMVGGVYDQELLDQLYANALSYLHGHSVGGTNPSLLRAMGAGTLTLAWDVGFNREVLGSAGRFFTDSESLARELAAVEASPAEAVAIGATLRDRAREHYDWDRVTDEYERLAEELAAGESTRGQSRGKRNAVPWSVAGTGGRVDA